MAQKLDAVVHRLGEPRVEMMDAKLPRPRDRLNTEDQSKYRLMSAASVGHIDSLSELVEQKGVNADSRSFDNRTALHVACAGGQFEAAKFLVEHKADINAKDRYSSTPLDEAMKSETRSEPLIEYLIAQGAQITPGSAETSLINLCAQKASPANVSLAESILKAKVNPDCADYDGRTPLHLAVAEANVTLAKLLLDNGANPMSKDRWKNTPWEEVARFANRSGVNEMSKLFSTHPSLEHLQKAHSTFQWTDFALMFGGMQLLFIILMFATATYSSSTEGGDAAVALAGVKMQMYPFFQDVNVMIFIGFGYLMVFLRKNAFNSLGVTFLACALVIQWHMLVDGFMVQAFCDITTHECDPRWHKIPLGLDNMIFADFCAGAVMISYGALLGKVSPMQMCIIAFIEVIFYAVNENFGKALKVSDIGGTIVIHMFGAYFGLAASVALRNKNASTHVNNSSVYHSDLMAMVGTIFLWLYWPSFNGATSANPASQQRVVLNTFISLSASCLMSFVASHLIRREKKFNMVDIQNATLAGGVAMGSAADMLLSPGAAVTIGSIAGTLSVIGYVYVQPFLESKIGFHDTCGVNNLHGMPSILGALSGTIASSLSQSGEVIAGYGDIQLTSTFPLIAEGSRSAQTQALSHLAFIGITLVFALVTGALTGILIRSCTWCKSPDGELLFNDASYWETPQLENPYYFDHRGEIQRGEDRGEQSSNLEQRVIALENKRLVVTDSHESNHETRAAAQERVSTDPRHVARAHIRRLIEDEQDKARLFAALDAKLIADLTDPDTNDGERLAALTLKLHPPNSAPETVLAQMWREILDNKKKGL
jgi:ammonium transporter Rh